MRFAVRKRLTKSSQQHVFDARIVAQQIFARRHHMLDHFVESGELLPGFAVGVETAHAGRDLTAEEKLIEQYHRVGLAALQDAKKFLLRIAFPAQLVVV